MTGQTQEPDLSGTLHQLPFSGAGLGTRVAPIYAELAAEHGPDRVLTLKRFPTGTEQIATDLRRSTDAVERPEVVGLSVHARRVIEELAEPPRVLDASERELLVEQHLAEHEWETPLLQRAAQHESFTEDVSKFIFEATWQGRQVQAETGLISELAAVSEAFHGWLSEHDLLDGADALRFTGEALADPALRERIQRDFDAVLVLEFEEFTPVDRRYLSNLSQGVALHCTAEQHSSIQRTWNEAGTIAEQVAGMTVREHAPDPRASEPAAVGAYLATGEERDRPDAGAVQRIEATSFEEHIRVVAAEIERLNTAEGISYREMAVAVRDSTGPIAETIHLLRQSGVPTESATVRGLAHDPAARELLAVAQLLAESADSSFSVAEARATLSARCGEVPAALLDEIQAEESIQAGIERWLHGSGLKARVAAGKPLEARHQFDHIQQLVSVAQFVDESPLITGGWERFLQALELEFQLAVPDKVAGETDASGDGVRVDAVRVLKNEEYQAVFVVDATDSQFPAPIEFNALLPKPQVQETPGYPAVTAPTAADVGRTFPTEGDSTHDPLRAYYQALSRRVLGVAARVAQDRLYLCAYRSMADAAETHRPSRFISQLEERLWELEQAGDAGIHSHGQLRQFALSRLSIGLQRIRYADAMEMQVPLDDLHEDLQALQVVLHDEGLAEAEQLREALSAQRALAAGGVRRD